MNGSRHRRRYQLLQDRRRLTFELERLGRRIVEHDSWAPSAELELALLGHWRAPRPEPPDAHASISELVDATRDLSDRLVLMARIWLTLERGEQVAFSELDDPPG